MTLIICKKPIQILRLLVLLSSFFCSKFSFAANNITLDQPITDPETIVSSNGVFKLGFFSPINTTNRHVGIWYNNIPKLTVIWVANRGKPINDSSGTMAISKDGNLVILNGQKEILWSSNVVNSTANTSAQLSDSGDLILLDISNGRTLWESFQHPSDSFVQKMRISDDVNTGEKISLTSWRSPSDPSIGMFSLGIDLRSLPEVVVWDGSRPRWRSGPWDGQAFIGIQRMDSFYHNSIDLVDDKQGTIYLTFSYTVDFVLLYFQLNSDGTLVRRFWSLGMQDSEVGWSAPDTGCDYYGKCGPFGTCNTKSSPICSCLEGFEPKHEAEWKIGNFTAGCVRRTPLQCGGNSSTTTQENSKGDGFLKLTTMKVPDFVEWVPAGESLCQNQCLNSCSCTAYTYHKGIGCMTWTGSLIDLQKFNSGGIDFYLRVAYSELDGKKDMKVVLAISLTIGSITVAVLVIFSWVWLDKKPGRKKMSEILLLPDHSGDNVLQDKFEELPQFKFQMLLVATDNFHDTNKLGQGGFGPVYKGKLQDGQEIAVKRLSRSSGQGLEEFMNEVMVISKLQHRNLVRLLGCCVECEEKMLIYEYMSNKSLDVFLFDSLKQELLDWRRRIKIIEGIGRGLLYLHRDSRLRIIHRDLKASNILLDEDLNPKISDFGMARIFEYNEDQANTRRVVGTYGYMAPEYAMEGRFSEKSDVFSFGVLLLEIVSGRRNTSFYNDRQYLSLVGFAWNLWNTNNVGMLADPKVSQEGFQTEILRCIHVGLLCVQEFAEDRPTVSMALSMLSSEIAQLPKPKQPPFSERLISSETESSREDKERCSANQVSITMVDAR